MAKVDLTDALPGLEQLVPVSDDVDMHDGQRFTAEVLFRDHRQKFERVCKLLFQAGLSDAMIAGIERVSRNTVRAIRDMVVTGARTPTAAAAAAFFVKSRATNARKLVALRALEVIRERLDEGSDDLTIEQLTRLAEIADDDDQQSATSGRSKSSSHDDAEVIDVDSFDAVLDGLSGEKKRAGDSVVGPGSAVSVDEPVGDGGESSTGSDSRCDTLSNRGTNTRNAEDI